MENSLNTSKTDKVKSKRNKRASVNKKQIVDASADIAALDKRLESVVQNKSINIMARRYELAYTKLFNELPVWKQHSFKNSPRNDDTLYNEFIANVIVLAEDTSQEILLTA